MTFVVPITTHGHLFHVLRLSPGSMAPPTPFDSKFDSILPSAATFFNGIDKLQANQTQYPRFTAGNCGWHAVFECIAQPALLWDCWGSGSLWMNSGVATGTHSKKGHFAAWQPQKFRMMRMYVVSIQCIVL